MKKSIVMMVLLSITVFSFIKPLPVKHLKTESSIKGPNEEYMTAINALADYQISHSISDVTMQMYMNVYFPDATSTGNTNINNLLLAIKTAYEKFAPGEGPVIEDDGGVDCYRKCSLAWLSCMGVCANEPIRACMSTYAWCTLKCIKCKRDCAGIN